MSQKEIINEIIKVLKKGGVILYPTDTVWGIGCDATNENAIKKIYQIKKRQEKKPLIILIHDPSLLEDYIDKVPSIAYEKIKQVTEPTTIIYENPIKLPRVLTCNNTIGIRVIKDNNLNLLLRKLNRPITSTSANISTTKSPKSFSEIDSYIKNNVDYIVPENFIKQNKNNKASRIIKITNNSEIQIIRE